MRACEAARHAESLILDRFRQEAECPFHRIGASIEPMKVSEETLTEMMLLDLATRYSDVIRVVTFTRTTEARRTGADWAWIIRSQLGPMRMLVQAKRIEEHVSTPPNWHVVLPYDKNRHTGETQHETLLASAKRLAMSPVYCMYFPGRRKHVCSRLFPSWEFDLWEPWYPPFRLAGSMHIVRAESQSLGRLQVSGFDPPGITLSELLCCVYGRNRDEEVSTDEHKWMFRGEQQAEQSFEALVEEIRSLDSVNIAGAVEVRLRE